jgi:hypothetical protein
VELVAALPVVVVLAVAIGQFLAARAAGELAGHAAEAGAVALLEGADPVRMAREALPGWSRSRVRVAVVDRHVRVWIRPREVLPGLGRVLTATSEADAGPQP